MAEETTTKRSPRKKVLKATVASGKRKRAIARASVSKGTGRITFNGRHLSLLSDATAREIIVEPLSFVTASDYDVSVKANGGGVMGQAQAARTAIAKALIALSGDPTLKAKMVAFDRSMVINDPRRVEPKKFKGPKARARFTKSYR
jgi:small subunit ribosomal protein S9